LSDQLPPPLTPPDCNLRGLQWMPLDVQWVIDSSLFLTSSGDEFKAAFALWCKSWTQIPAGSLPSDERELAGLSQAKNWKRVREQAMRNWVLCSDNRYYHPVIAAKALEALPSRKDFEHKKSAEAERKARERADRAALFELLRANGIVPEYNTKTAALRELAKPFQAPPVTPDVTSDKTDEPVTDGVTCGVTSHGPVTARRGTPEGQGEDREVFKNPPGSVSAAPPAPPARVKGDRASRKPPADFEVTPAMVLWAEEHAPKVNLQRETDKFRDHTFKFSITDWPGAWRNWLRRAHDDVAKAPDRSFPSSGETPYQRSQRETVAAFTGGLAARKTSEDDDVQTPTFQALG
jgi:hypothetical protein